MLPVAIIAGGKGTRIATIAGTLPKALIPVAGAPFIEHQLRRLAAGGVERVVLCTGYRGDAVAAFAGDGSRFGLQVSYSDDGDRARGTGGAIARALPLLGDAFLTLYGDAILQCPPAAVAAALGDGDDGVMTVFENHDRWLPSNVRIAGDRVVAYTKGAPAGTMTHIDYGINAFRAAAFAEFDADAAFDLADVHRAAIARGRLRALPCAERWFEVGSPEGLAETERFLLSESP